MLAGEEDDTKDEEDGNDGCTIAQIRPTELTCTISSVLERLDDRRHRVERHDTMQRGISDITERIDNRRCVHPEADEDTEEIDQVAVLGGHRRDDKAQAHCQAGHHQHQDREEQEVPVRHQMDTLDQGKEEIDQHEHTELDREAEQARDTDRERADQTREIDLAIKARILLERAGHIGQAGGEILPQADAREVEHRLRHIVGRDIRNTSEDHHIHHHREERGDEVPAHAEDGLFELDDDIAFDKEPDEVALAPELF